MAIKCIADLVSSTLDKRNNLSMVTGLQFEIASTVDEETADAVSRGSMFSLRSPTDIGTERLMFEQIRYVDEKVWLRRREISDGLCSSVLINVFNI